MVGAGCAGADFVAAFMTDLKLNMLKPLVLLLGPGVLDLLEPSGFVLLPSKFSIAPPIAAAAPINDEPINPAAAADGLSNGAIEVNEAKHDDHYRK